MERTHPWARLGNRLDEPAAPDEALAAAGLDWAVDLVDIQYGAESKNAAGWAGVVRPDTGDLLGIVASQYRPLDNEQAFKPFVSAAAELGIDVHAAWERNGGRTAGMAAPVETVALDNGEQLDLWLEATTGHDGKHALAIRPVFLQLVCLNQLPPALQALAGASSVRAVHTLSVAEATNVGSELAQSIDLLAGGVADAANSFMATAVDSASRAAALDKAARCTGLTPRGRETACEGVEREYNHRATMHSDARGTAWGVLHAATEYWTHTRPHRSPTSAWNALNASRGDGKLFCNGLVRALHAMA